MILYLETSNLVKIYAQERESEQVLALVHEASVVATSIVAYAETRAAFARKWREKGIGENDLKSVKADLDRDWNRFFVLGLCDETVRRAGDFCEKHGLRGFDALHLASAAILARAVAAPIAFSSSDLKLRQAAAKEGLSSA